MGIKSWDIARLVYIVTTIDVTITSEAGLRTQGFYDSFEATAILAKALAEEKAATHS